MDDVGGSGAPPGWYADPSGHHVWRWWTGTAWSEQFAPVAGSPSAHPTVAPPLRRRVDVLQGEQARLDPWVPWVVWGYVVASVAGAVVLWRTAGYLRDLWHWLHRAFHAIGLHQTPPPQPHVPWWYSLASLSSYAVIALEALFLVWQYRAAATARELGYPARRSPGWGVGCWFVPVVNLWMPYQALRDCLPPDHPGARRVLWTWLLLLATVALGAAVPIAAIGSGGPVVALSVAGVVLRIPLGILATRVVRDIAADHRRAVGASEGP